MSANILVIEYEPRYLEHVQAALADAGFHLEIAGNIDDAVDRCAQFEPTVVIITSVLPNLKIEDAITQLRARAGLRATPVSDSHVRLPGRGSDRGRERYGAQDILQRPFDREASARGSRSWCGRRRTPPPPRQFPRRCWRRCAAVPASTVTASR